MFDHNTNYVRILFSLILFTVLVIPILSLIISKKSRLWLKQGIEGENKKLDLFEIWELIYMIIAVGSFFLIVFMIIMKTIENINYSWEEYLLAFLGTAGSNGVSALIIYLKNKTNAKD